MQNPPTNTLIRLAEPVLTLNHFVFDNDYYTQCRGVSMGTRMGPSYSCLFMGWFEHEFLSSYDGVIPDLYKRYIDDIFGSALCTYADLDRFLSCLGKFHPAIAMTYDISESDLPVLDIKTRLQDGCISTTVYYKPTDKHSFLRWDSHHPLKCKRSIPYSQFLRLRRLCSSEAFFKEETEKMKGFFVDRGYPLSVINEGLERAASVSREVTLTNVVRPEVKKIPLVVPYCRQTQRISSIVKRNARILASDSEIGAAFQNNIMLSYKNFGSVGSMMIRAALPSDEIPGTFPCGHRNCKTCPYVSGDCSVVGPDASFTIKHSFDCSNRNVIYALTCLKCGLLYIGETGDRLGKRFRDHVRDVKNKRTDRTVSVHFNNCVNGDTDFMAIQGLLTVHGIRNRKLKEISIIKELNTLIPFGMNKENDSWKKATDMIMINDVL